MSYSARIIAAVVTATAAITLGTSGCSSESGDSAPNTSSSTQQVRSGIPDSAATFEASSPDVAEGQAIPRAQWADGFGCTEAGKAPRVRWSNAPAGTRSFAVTMFDRDAPTGSGFWHWVTWDIGAQATELGDGAAAVAGTNDAGATGYLGACPPSGDRAHNYVITVLALDTPSLALPASTPPAVATFTMNSHVIGYARLTASAERP
ncbi:YbhB/YbcL family Raf kinase inhibitor-like protein [Rhodococcus spelaei]|uniref:YbhB/YbcL family Raf kinase inhibitor-like protein n=1 Tax=Rhodococcus spelaei TaxID=2546320 RepID=A0A541BAB7_9NOCA|nr:YbhB/YbcL family Raf kinase inhibitor-like protein [Rhodococcus spelaei]TQF69282.1 YbhB/YbcL family Raf kinase inhibitor-like protein [Rhodococcus spelaei]